MEYVQNFVIFSIFPIDRNFGLTVFLLQCFPMSNSIFLLVAGTQGQHNNQWFIVWYVQHCPVGLSFGMQKFQSKIILKNDRVSENFIFSLNYVQSSEIKKLALQKVQNSTRNSMGPFLMQIGQVLEKKFSKIEKIVKIIPFLKPSYLAKSCSQEAGTTLNRLQIRCSIRKWPYFEGIFEPLQRKLTGNMLKILSFFRFFQSIANLG